MSEQLFTHQQLFNLKLETYRTKTHGVLSRNSKRLHDDQIITRFTYSLPAWAKEFALVLQDLFITYLRTPRLPKQ